MHRVRAADGGHPGLGEPEVAHLAFLDQALHRTDGFFDRGLRIDAMLIVEIDDLDTEPFEARFAARSDVVRLAAHAARHAARFSHDAEFGRQVDLRASAVDRTADEL